MGKGGGKLFTPEDPVHSHKLLGMYALIHFAYRYVVFFFRGRADMGFAATSPLTPWLLLPHALLQVSGLQFHLPRHRIKEGSRQWPEYRWHALAFAARSLALMLLAHHHHRLLRAAPLLPAVAPLAAVVCTMLAADAVTRHFRVRGQSSRTIRDLQLPPGMQYAMSALQFHATVGCLLTEDRLSVQLVSLCVIQCAAFVMTLRRRNLITHVQDVGLYGALLLLGFLVILADLRERSLFWVAVPAANAAALARLDGRVNKYALWVGVAAALPPLQRYAAAPAATAALQLATILSTAALARQAARRQ